MRRRVPTLWTLALLACGPATPEAAPDRFLDPSQVLWRRLSFKASKLFLSARSELRLETQPRAVAEAALIGSPEGVPVAPSAPETLLLHLDSAVAGRRSTDRVWFEPADGRTLQRWKLKPSGGRYRKIYRFADRGVFLTRVEPGPSEASRPPAEWTGIEERFLTYQGAHGCRLVIEPVVLFYLLSASALDEADGPLELCAFSRERLHRLTVTAEGREPLAFRYRQGSEERRGETEALRFAVRAAGGGEGFELLGLEGEITLLLDARTRLPLELRGRIPPLGGVRATLREVELTGRSVP